MLKIASVSVIIFTLLGSVPIGAFFRSPVLKAYLFDPENVGDPLILTPYIKSGRIHEALNLAEVKPIVGSVKSYAGLLTVNETYDSNIFFWFFPAEIDPLKAPVAVWLQGGPGVSSLFGLFSENGPYELQDDGTITLRKYSWTKRISMLYFDNPVGVGYSQSNCTEGYAKNEHDVGVNLYKAVIQFFSLFPELRKNDFFVTGESYGGKYAPAFAYEIHQNNKIFSPKVNLKGVAVGNGFSDPVHMLNYADYLYQIGLIDENTRKVFADQRDKAVKLINKGQYDEAFKVFDAVLDNDLNNSSSIFTNATGFTSYYNFLVTDESSIDLVARFVQSESLRSHIHVGNLTFHIDKKVEIMLKNDIMRSVAPLVEELLEHYHVMFYNGQLDIIVAYPLTEQFLKSLKWSAANEYKTAPRHIWKIKNKIAGYCKTAGNLIEVLVRNAGHMVPADQPLFAFDLINRFVFSKRF